ncbi:Uncharacterised protein [Mycobacterium tuberculosis]|uniref:Uncharacterized protein n=1 Tax=Mycobacterium tuberculosis TaxID=1773 RepID=A0A916LH96_MYCTX|nr:Uncharacterised protein [Mycobacterium tuberculosis]
MASSRDTCICEIPTRSAICVWVIESKNLSTKTVRSRSGNASSNGRSTSRFSIWSRPASTSPRVSVIARASSSLPPPLSMDKVW